MKKTFVPVLALMLACSAVHPLLGFSEGAYRSNVSLDVPTLVDGAVNVPGGNKKIAVSAYNNDIRTVLSSIADKGHLNLMIDPSVTGSITMDLSNVTLNQALQSVASMNDLLILKQNGGIYLAITRQAAKTKNVSRQLSKVIKVYYSSAVRLANILNRSLFATANGSSGSSGSSSSATAQKVTAEPQTNTLVVVGTAREIELVEAAVSKLDIPRQSKTFYLSNANALDVATMLASSVFNDGTASVKVGNATSSSTTTANGGIPVATPATMRVERQDVQEGNGINAFGGGNGNGVTSGLSSSVTLRGFAKTTDNLSLSPDSVLLVPDTRQNSLTVMGTAEQIALAESMIPKMDAQVPQVAIEASLIEITSSGSKELGTRWGTASRGIQSGFNNVGLDSVGNVSSNLNPNNLIGVPTVDPTDNSSFARSSLVFTSNPITNRANYVFELRRLISESKARLLANPTVVANHDTESIISIVDEIVRRVNVTVSNGTITQTIEIGEAGIVMDVLPKIGEDGTISLRMRPSVTSVLNQTRDSQGNLITLLSKRDLLTENVRVHDGETLVLGGLIQERSNVRIDKLPGLGDLPIVGAMFRSQSNGSSANPNRRSELVMMITPHIINNTKVTPVNTLSTAPAEAAQTRMAKGN